MRTISEFMGRLGSGKGMRKKIAACAVASALAASMLGACSSGDVSSQGAENELAESEGQAETLSADVGSMDFEYTERDLDPSYDETEAVTVSLGGSSAQASGQGVVVDGSVVTVGSEGTYVFEGSLDDGQIVVDVSDSEKVQIVLNGVTVHNEDGPAIYVKNADKCFVTLADGSQNVLTDGSEYVLEEGSDEPYATFFSRADLTLNGTGALTVVSSYRHAVCSKDDLVICGGTYVIESVEDALRGRDCVKICDGSFVIEAGKDAVKSNKDDDPSKGFVSIDGGEFDIVAGDEGIQAVTYLRVMDGVLNIDAADDALHSDVEALLSDGALNVAAGDDAVHAETVLTVYGGEIDVSACYEGYEAEKVYVNGGNTRIVADDDALNATAADLSTSSEEESERAIDGGTPPSGMMEAGGVGAGDENCLIQVNDGYIVLTAGGDGVDSNGSFEMNGGVLLVNGPADGENAALDYDLEATVNGGTIIAVGSRQMAQNFSGGSQPFSYATVDGQAGESVSVVSEDGTVLCSMQAARAFSSVVVSCSQFSEGQTYDLVIGGVVSEAGEDGWAEGGSVEGGSTTQITASTTASGGFGGLGADGEGKPAGEPGDVREGSRGKSFEGAPEGQAPDEGAPSGDGFGGQVPEGELPDEGMAAGQGDQSTVGFELSTR